jgi:hypothetical protein
MSLLDKLLSKNGISNLDELTSEERAIYDGYKLTLTAKDVTVKNIENFCRSQVKLIEDKFGSPETKYDAYLKACLHVYLTILKAIEAPKVERENMERYLIALIKEQ